MLSFINQGLLPLEELTHFLKHIHLLELRIHFIQFGNLLFLPLYLLMAASYSKRANLILTPCLLLQQISLSVSLDYKLIKPCDIMLHVETFIAFHPAKFIVQNQIDTIFTSASFWQNFHLFHHGMTVSLVSFISQIRREYNLINESINNYEFCEISVKHKVSFIPKFKKKMILK